MNLVYTLTDKGKGMAEQNTRFRITSASFVLMIAYGISFTMIGPLMPEVLDRFSLSMAAGGGIVSVQNLAGLAAILICGMFGDRWNKGAVMVLGIFLFAVSLIGIGWAGSYSAIIILFILLGLGSRGFDTLSNALISDLYGERRSLYLNLLHTFFGVGAFLGPMFVLGISRFGWSWEVTFAALGLASAVIFPVFLLIILRMPGGRLPENRVPAAESGAESTGRGILSLLRHRDIWVLGAVMFLHMGTLGVLITWMPLFAAQTVGSGRFLSALSLSLAWLGIIISRSLVSRLSGRLGEIPMIRWGGFLSALVFGAALVSGSPILITFGSLMTGIGIGFTIPFVMSVGCRRFPRDSAAVTSLMFVFGYLSVVVYPWMSGMLGDTLGLQSAMLPVPASQLVLFALTWMIRKKPDSH